MKIIIKKIELFVLFLICLFYCLIRKKDNKKSRQSNKFLIIQMGKLGDIVCITPIFRAIKKKNPENQVFVLSNKNNIEILDNNNDIDGFFVYNKKGFWKIVREVREKEFNIGICVSPGFLGLSFLCLSGIKYCLAPTIKRSNAFDRGYYKIIRKMFAVSVEYKFGEYMPRQYLKLLEFVDIFSDEVKKILGFSDIAVKKTKKLLDENGVILNKDIIINIHVGAGNKLKLWGASRWAELINQLQSSKQYKVILLGGKSDIPEIEKILPLLNKKIINFSNLFNIDELKAVINYSDIFIGTDSGPIYIAEAFDKYTIDITGPVDEKEQPPSPPYYRKGYLVFKSDLFCRPCSFVFQTARNCRYNNLRCFSEIEVKDILKVVDEIVFKIKK